MAAALEVVDITKKVADVILSKYRVSEGINTIFYGEISTIFQDKSREIGDIL